MSYCRSPFYIYPTGMGERSGVEFDGTYLADDILNVWLACLTERPRDEMARRIEHGNRLLNEANVPPFDLFPWAQEPEGGTCAGVPEKTQAAANG